MTNLLEQVKIYKTLLEGSTHNTFSDVMFCKVSGVSFDGRQKNVRRVGEDTLLKLVRDRRNEHDFYAVSVHALINGEWKDVGFLPKEINRDIALALDSGIKVGAKVWRKVGGGEENYYHGLTITVKRIEE